MDGANRGRVRIVLVVNLVLFMAAAMLGMSGGLPVYR
jgi:hypothetical protein